MSIDLEYSNLRLDILKCSNGVLDREAVENSIKDFCNKYEEHPYVEKLWDFFYLILDKKVISKDKLSEPDTLGKTQRHEGTTDEDVQIVAEFMGGFRSSKTPGYICIEVNPPIKGQIWYSINSELLYRSSWDWLMPVVEKIESLGFQLDFGSRLLPDGKGKDSFAAIWYDDTKVRVLEVMGLTKKEVVYSIVVEFIKWYKIHNK